MTRESPVRLIERHHPAAEERLWQMRTGVVVDVPERWPVVGWRMVADLTDAHPLNDDEALGLPSVPRGRAVSEDARCQTSSSDPRSQLMTAPHESPDPRCFCGYRIVRDWTVLMGFLQYHRHVTNGIPADAPMFVARVRGWGRTAQTAEATDPDNTLRVQRFAIDCILHDESSAYLQPALRAAYPSMATCFYTDGSLTDLAAETAGPVYDPTRVAGWIRQMTRVLAFDPESI